MSYVWAAYLITVIVLATYAVWVVVRGRTLARALEPERDHQS